MILPSLFFIVFNQVCTPVTLLDVSSLPFLCDLRARSPQLDIYTLNTNWTII